MSMIDYIVFFVIVVANWRIDDAKSPDAMLQEETARKPHTLRVADVVRTYITQVECLFCPFDTWYALFLCLYVRKRKYSTPQQHSKDNENDSGKFGKKKYHHPLSCNYCLPDWNTLYPVKKKKVEKLEQKRFSLSLVRRPPLSRPSRS